VLRAVYGLLRGGILERVDPERPEVPLKVQEETGFFLLSTLGDDDDDTEAEDVRQEVLLEYESSEHASAEKLLDIEASASNEEIRRAFALKQVQWNKTQRELDNESTLCVKVDEIKQRLERAKAAMLEPERTRTPVEPTESSPKPAADKDEIQRLTREIKLRKTKNDVEGVISLLYEIVQLEPENAKYETLLARTLASHGAMKKKAERHYRRAVSLDPQNAELHYHLGRYYQSFDMNLRAIAELKTALQINPDFSEARSALVGLQGDDTFLEDRLEKLLS